MKLRQVLRALSGFRYEVAVFDILPDKVTKTQELIRIDETNLRCLQFDAHHEQLVEGYWYIIQPQQFESILKDARSRNVKIRRKDGTTQTKTKVLQTEFSRLVVTHHFSKRLKERFGVELSTYKPFIQDVLTEHRMVQDSQLYNHKMARDLASGLDPSDLCLCSIKHDIIVVGRLTTEGKFLCVTAYRLKDTKWFSNWFQDNLDRWSELPKLKQFFVGGR